VFELARTPRQPLSRDREIEAIFSGAACGCGGAKPASAALRRSRSGRFGSRRRRCRCRWAGRAAPARGAAGSPPAARPPAPELVDAVLAAQVLAAHVGDPCVLQPLESASRYRRGGPRIPDAFVTSPAAARRRLQGSTARSAPSRSPPSSSSSSATTTILPSAHQMPASSSRWLYSRTRWKPMPVSREIRRRAPLIELRATQDCYRPVHQYSGYAASQYSASAEARAQDVQPRARDTRAGPHEGQLPARPRASELR
jgi:hypothetical protein